MAFFREFAGIVISLVIVVGSFVAFSLSVAVTTGVGVERRERAATVSADVDIYRNRFSVPHIIATSQDDAFFALGVVHAEDRLWQMDMMRRAGQGRLSEVFGARTLTVDKFFRSLDIDSVARAVFKRASKQTLRILEAYSRGVNHVLGARERSLPFEFGALGYEPDPWRPEDCLVIIRLFTYELSSSIWADLALSEIADRVGIEKASTLIPRIENGPTVVPGSGSRTVPLAQRIDHRSGPWAPLHASVLHQLEEVRRFMGQHGSSVGSNSWVMRYGIEADSSVILASDPHLNLSLPARWYPAHCTFPGFNVTGLTIPGLPLFPIGRNDYISWGITSMMLDDMDYFVEKIDDKRPDYYLHPDGGWKKFTYVVDTIKVKDDPELVYSKRYTARSCVISENHLFETGEKVNAAMGKLDSNKFLRNYALTYSWTGHISSDEIQVMFSVNRAKSWREFTGALDRWGSPGLVFTFGDRNGNIGAVPAGVTPVREDNLPDFASPSWLPRMAWKGYRSSASLPRVYNPEKRFVVSANNNIAQALPYHISSWFDHPVRAQRIKEMLDEFDDYTTRDAEFMQLDVTSLYAAGMMQKVLPVLESKKRFLTGTGQEILTAFKGWTGVMLASDPRPAIFTVFQTKLLELILGDELPNRVLKQYLFVGAIPTRMLPQLLSDSSSAWFDIKGTPEIESKEEIVFRAFYGAIQELQGRFGGEPWKNWRYGRIHQLTFTHAFSENALISKIVTQGPFETPGASTTLNNGEFSFTAPFNQKVGASARFVADMKDTAVLCVVPGGISGQPLSAHYSDQIQLWLRGGYTRIRTLPSPDPQAKLALRISPK